MDLTVFYFVVFSFLLEMKFENACELQVYISLNKLLEKLKRDLIIPCQHMVLPKFAVQVRHAKEL